ncbi:MAG: hypothetical protein RL215_1725 [Planctomycetota bacterium]
MASNETHGEIQTIRGPGNFPGWRRPLRSFWWCLHIGFGAACIVLSLAVLAAIPGLNILTLGCLIEPQRRVALSGRLRDGFPLLVLAPRLGVLILGVLIYQLPLRFLSTRVSDAIVLLGPDHPRTLRMTTILTTLQWIVALHLLLAILNGSSPGCYLRPFRNLRRGLRLLFTTAGRQQLAAGIDAVLGILQPVRHFILGLKAFFGAILWLVIPASLMVSYAPPDRAKPIFGLLTALGVALMIPVAAWLPFLQVQQAAEGRFRGILAVAEVRRRIRAAPIAWLLSTILIYTMTFPLYLGKIQLPPSDALLVLTPVFVVLIYPARLAVAWAWHRGNCLKTAPWLLHIAARIAMLPVLAAYSIFLMLTPTISELGRNAPFENQAFLGPAPAAQWNFSPDGSTPPRKPQQNPEDTSEQHRSQPHQGTDQPRPDTKQSI